MGQTNKISSKLLKLRGGRVGVHWLIIKRNQKKMELSDKNVCVVADGMGIAFETCKVLMTKKLAKLAILHNVENPKAIEQLQAIDPKTQIYFWKFTVTMDGDKMKEFFDEIMEQMNYIDVLINGATICKESDIERTIAVNLTGLIKTTTTVLPHMDKSKEGRGGLIVNLASVIGLDPSPVFCVYSAAKFGVVGFTRSLANQNLFDETGVAVVAVCPGPTKTFVRHNMTAYLSYGQEHVDKLKEAPSQDTSVCGQNIVKAIESSRNGNIWIADMGQLVLVKPKLYWKMSDELINYLHLKESDLKDSTEE